MSRRMRHALLVLFGLMVFWTAVSSPAEAAGPPATKPSSPIIAAEFVYDSAPFRSVHASTLAETKQGLVAAFFGGKDEGNDDVCIYVSRKEGGRWSPPRRAADGGQGEGETPFPCWNPVLYAAPGGPLVLFYKVGASPETWHGMAKRSDDGGKTWSAAWALPEGILGPIKNKPIALDDGTLVCPSSTEHGGWRVHMEFTRDLGQSFTRTAALNDGKKMGLIQPTLLRHGDGLIALCRSRDLGSIVSLESTNRGKTWTAPVATGLPNPNSGIDGVTLADGRCLLVYNPTTRGRSPLSVAASADGRTWERVLDLETGEGEYSYPAVIQTADGLVHVSYTWRREKVRHVTIDPTLLRPPGPVDK